MGRAASHEYRNLDPEKEVDERAVWAGEVSAFVRHVEPAGDVVCALVAEADACRAAGPRPRSRRLDVRALVFRRARLLDRRLPAGGDRGLPLGVFLAAVGEERVPGTPEETREHADGGRHREHRPVRRAREADRERHDTDPNATNNGIATTKTSARRCRRSASGSSVRLDRALVVMSGSPLPTRDMWLCPAAAACSGMQSYNCC